MARFKVKQFTTSCPGDLLDNINSNVNIAKTCIEIVSRGKNTFFVFDGKLDSGEETELDAILSSWACPSPLDSISSDTLDGAGAEVSEKMCFTYDESRSKDLSAETATFTYSEANITNMDWVQIGGASDADTGMIMPYDGTVIRTTGFCENVKHTTMNIHLYINTTSAGSILTFTGSGNQTETDLSLNIDFNAGDRLRLRGVGSNRIEDTAVTLWVKWRKA